MNLHQVTAKYMTETFIDPYGVGASFKGAIRPFAEVTNSGPSSRRRILETLPSGWTAPEEPAAPAEAEAENQPEEASGTESDTEGAEAAPAEDPTAAAAEQQ